MGGIILLFLKFEYAKFQAEETAVGLAFAYQRALVMGLSDNGLLILSSVLLFSLAGR